MEVPSSKNVVQAAWCRNLLIVRRRHQQTFQNDVEMLPTPATFARECWTTEDGYGKWHLARGIEQKGLRHAVVANNLAVHTIGAQARMLEIRVLNTKTTKTKCVITLVILAVASPQLLSALQLVATQLSALSRLRPRLRRSLLRLPH